MMGAFLRKYATASRVYIPMIKRGVVDFAVGADWTPAAGDVKVSIDGGAVANIGTLPVAIASGNGAFWDFTIATGETTGKKITITIVDAATKVVEDQCFEIETYGHASAEYVADLSADSAAVIAAAVMASTGDTAITLTKALEMLAAFTAGKVSSSSAGGFTTYTWKKRDGTTTSFTCICDETDATLGTRTTTGALS